MIVRLYLFYPEGFINLHSESLKMNCLLVAATANEIAPFLEHYRNTEKRWHIDMNIDVLITGAGMTATTYQLVKQFNLKRPDLVLQAGITGCFDKKVPLGSVVVIKQDVIADESVVEQKKLHSLFDLKLASKNQSPYKNGCLINPGTGMIKRSKLKVVNAISVNHITTSGQMVAFYKEKFNPVTESMEGAALHYVCLMEKISFLQVRAVSNYIAERNKKNWKIKESITNLNNELIRLLESL